MSNNPKTTEINGRRLHYVDQGEEDQQPIIFIHGGLDDYRCWQFQLDSFSNKYRVISYSRRFAYPNKWIGNVAQDNTVEDNTKDLAELIRKVRPCTSTPNRSFIRCLYCIALCIKESRISQDNGA
jgi:pimeloyl-ACP methyl ester carboxylesterase